MTLAVIGAGVGRTGTTSLKAALEQLGFGPCYHMHEVLAQPTRAEAWLRAAAGEVVEWDDIFRGYHSTTDWPACDYWQELAVAYPEAKIILTVRDAEAWFASTQNTIFGPIVNATKGDESPIPRLMGTILTRFEPDINDRERCIAAYEKHNARVRALAPPDRLLTYNVAEGWEPLCRFLDAPVPQTPFPHANTSNDFQEKARAMMQPASR